MKDIGGVEVPEYLAKLTDDSSTESKTASDPKPNGQPVASNPAT
jgi:hypothetical protein